MVIMYVCEGLDYATGRTRDVLKNHISSKNKWHKYALEGHADLALPLE